MASSTRWLAVAAACLGMVPFACGGAGNTDLFTASTTGGPGGSGGSGGGTGGSACRDGDGDGQTDCDGDCDDADPTNYKGNVEVCGDGHDNNCDGAADEAKLCQGMGTFVSQAVGDDANPGTQESPVKTIGQGIKNAITIGGGVDVFVAQGQYSEKVALVEGIDLLGGHDCAAKPCSWARDPAKNDSTILNVDFQGVLADDTITSQTRIDGFHVVGFGGAPTAPGSVGISILGGAPMVTGNVITGGAVTQGPGNAARSIGVFVAAPTVVPGGPTIQGNDIAGGTSNESSLGILLEPVSWNPVPPPAVATIARNKIRGGTGKNAHGIAAWLTGAGTVIRGNRISAGNSTGGGSWGIAVGSVLAIDGNLINTDPATTGKCTSPGGWCGGIVSFSSTTEITNNVSFGIQSPKSAGVMLLEAEMPAGVVLLNGNTLDGGGVINGNSTISAAITLRTGFGVNAFIGKIRNNILLAGQGFERYGIYEDITNGAPQKTCHPVALENNDFFSAMGATALYRLYNGSSPTNLTTLAQVNGLAAQVPSVIVGANVSVDPLLDATFHLSKSPASPCIDAGTATEAPAKDFEGDARPMGGKIDIGADEAQ